MFQKLKGFAIDGVLAKVLCCVALAFALMHVLGVIFTEFDHNEHMYVAAGYLISQGLMLYSDFSYLQMPYLPFVYGLLIKLFGGVGGLFLGKLVNFLFFVGSAWILGKLSLRFSRSPVYTALIVFLFLMNVITLRAAFEASNYVAPIFFSFLAVYLFVRAFDKRLKGYDLVLSGFFLMMSVCIKLYYLPLFAPFVLVLFASAWRLNNGALPIQPLVSFTSGAVIGALPVAYFVLNDFDAFWFNNVGYHNLNAEWREMTGYSRMTLDSKFDFFTKKLGRADVLLVIVFSFFALFVSLMSIRKQGQSTLSGCVPYVLALMLLLFSFVVVFVPSPMFKQYFALPVSFVFMACAMMNMEFLGKRKAWVIGFLIVLSIHTVNKGFEFRWPAERALVHVQIERGAKKIKALMAERGVDGKLATLSPLYGLEAGLDIYPEFSTGPFLYRVGNLMSEQNQKKMIGTSADSLIEFLDAEPPGAILVGFEKKFDDKLREYAKARAYKLVPEAVLEGELYIRSI